MIAARLPAAGHPLRTERVAAVLGIALGISMTICFATGILSHLIQEPPSWFVWGPRPAGLYRFTQGLHVATGLAMIPIVVAKLWTVYPMLFVWPPVQTVLQAVERLALLPLIGGSIFLLVSGLGNINIWRPWSVDFRTAHHAVAWVTVGSLLIHMGAKAGTTLNALRRPTTSVEPSDTASDEQISVASAVPADGGLGRRGFLATVAGAAGAVTLFTVGQTYAPLRSIAFLAPRRPDMGPQGFPVNRTARAVGLTNVDPATYRLEVTGRGLSTPVSFTLAEMEAMEQRTATLPIACVEGWSTEQTWTGVPLRALLDAAGVQEMSEVNVVSLQRSRRLQQSVVNRDQVDDLDTLLALRVNGETLAPDHGYPVRLMGPNRPGVLQTKWLGRIEVS